MTPEIRCRPIGYYAIRNDPEFQHLLVGTEQIGSDKQGANESSPARGFSASVLKGDQHSRAVGCHLAIFNCHILFHDLGNAQVAQ